MELMANIKETHTELMKAISERGAQIREAAEAERLYRMALSEEVIKAKADGLPVSILRDVVRGKKRIADLDFRRRLAEGTADNAKEYIQALKKKLSFMEAQLDREWRG